MPDDRQAPTLKITIGIPFEGIEGALYGAFSSGGIAYWASVVEYNLGIGIGADDIDVAPLHGGWIRVQDTQDDDRVYEFNPKHLKRALELMPEKAPEQFAALFNGRWDKWTGDVLVQLALFGEVKYG